MEKEIIYFEAVYDSTVEGFDVNGNTEYSRKLRQLQEKYNSVIVTCIVYEDGSKEEF